MSSRKLRHKRRSQPRDLIEHRTREPKATCFPHEVTVGLNQIAWRERKSVSWVIATIVYDYFGLDETGFYGKKERIPLKDRLAMERKRA